MNVHLSKVAFEAALALARAEGKPLGQVIEPFLSYAAATPAPEGYLIYRVRAGDTLGTVARHFYGDGRKYPLLKKANNISSADELEEGLALVIPPAGTIVPESALPSPNPYGPHGSPSPAELEPLLSQALALIDEKAHTGALLALIPRLPEALVKEAWAAADRFEDVWEQSKLLAALAPRLAELGNPVAALKLAGEIKRGWSQATALARMAPHLPEPFLFQALTLTRTIARPEDQAAALIGLLPHLPEALRAEVVAEAAATVERIEGEPLRVEARTELLACLEALDYRLEVEPASSASEPEMLTPAEELSLIANSAEPPLKRKGRRRSSSRRPNLLGWLKPVWLAPLIILGLCGALLFTSGLALGSILLSDRDPALERVELPSNGHSLVSRTSLDQGKFYSIVVSGQFNYNIDQPESWADAQSSYYQRTGDWVSAYWFSIDGQKVIAQQADPTNHLYLFYVQGSSRPVKFRIEERRETEYDNNRGSLQVAIYSGLLNLDELEE